MIFNQACLLGIFLIEVGASSRFTLKFERNILDEYISEDFKVDGLDRRALFALDFTEKTTVFYLNDRGPLFESVLGDQCFLSETESLLLWKKTGERVVFDKVDSVVGTLNFIFYGEMGYWNLPSIADVKLGLSPSSHLAKAYSMKLSLRASQGDSFDFEAIPQSAVCNSPIEAWRIHASSIPHIRDFFEIKSAFIDFDLSEPGLILTEDAILLLFREFRTVLFEDYLAIESSTDRFLRGKRLFFDTANFGKLKIKWSLLGCTDARANLLCKTRIRIGPSCKIGKTLLWSVESVSLNSCDGVNLNRLAVAHNFSAEVNLPKIKHFPLFKSPKWYPDTHVLQFYSVDYKAQPTISAIESVFRNQGELVLVAIPGTFTDMKVLDRANRSAFRRDFPCGNSAVPRFKPYYDYFELIFRPVNLLEKVNTCELTVYLQNSELVIDSDIKDPTFDLLPDLDLAEPVYEVIDGDKCTICYEDFINCKKLLKHSQCNQKFCAACIHAWMKNQKAQGFVQNCPTCHSDLLVRRIYRTTSSLKFILSVFSRIETNLIHVSDTAHQLVRTGPGIPFTHKLVSSLIRSDFLPPITLLALVLFREHVFNNKGLTFQLLMRGALKRLFSSEDYVHRTERTFIPLISAIHFLLVLWKYSTDFKFGKLLLFSSLAAFGLELNRLLTSDETRAAVLRRQQHRISHSKALN